MGIYLRTHPEMLDAQMHYVELLAQKEILNLQRDVIRQDADLLRLFIVIHTLEQWRRSVLKPEDRLTECDKQFLRQKIKEQQGELTKCNKEQADGGSNN